MLFDSPVYILFLLLVVTLYWRLGFRKQNLMLLVASYFFYGWWDWRFLLLMIASTTVDFLLTCRMARSQNARERKTLLIVGLILNFSVLGFFKYFGFFLDSATAALNFLGVHGVSSTFLQVVLPPGISFYTFQEVAYIVDVYNRKLEPADRFVDYALFISLFPHLIAGPIQRPSHLLPQVEKPRVWNPDTVFSGLMLILEGMFRKSVIADNCALLADGAFNGKLGPPNLAVVLLGTYAFAWQIYGDFSAYSCIARGSAQLMGFHFMVNFRQPYLAESLQDFWRRWHISLSTWLRDYLYIPLGGNRLGPLRTKANLMATMLLGGLWHGANWTFVFWGAIHGLGLSAERLKGTTTPSRSATVWLRRLVVFHLVCFAWIFFRAASLTAAFEFISGLAVWQWQPRYSGALRFLALFSIPLFLLDYHLERSGGEYALEYVSYEKRIVWGAALFLVTCLLGANQANAFIYFQF